MSFHVARSRRPFWLSLLLLFSAANGHCDTGSWKLWQAYTAHFVDGQGRVIDHQAGDRTTSEGQSYALFFALVNGDRPQFDRLLAWTQANMAMGDMSNHLPGWLWGKGADGRWRLQDTNSAADSDCWIAYSLLEAGRLWQNPAYTGLGRRMMAQISRVEVAELPGFGWMLMPGPVSSFVHEHTWTVNPSYLPLFILERFAAVDSAGPWSQIAKNVPRLLQQSSRRGFAFDWANYAPGRGFFPGTPDGLAHTGREPSKAVGSYDAIRVYLWAGMLDREDQNRTIMLEAIAGMASYLAHHGNPPEKVSDQGVPLGQDGPVGFSAAVAPYLLALDGFEPAARKQWARLNELRDASTGLYGNTPAYYDQNLILFASGFQDGRFRFGHGGLLKVEWKQ